MTVDIRLGALVPRASLRATRAARTTKPRPNGLVALDLAESHQSYICGAALSREPLKLQQAKPLLTK